MKNFDPIDIHAREQARKDAESARNLAEMRAAEDLKFIMSDKRGRRFMRRLIEQTGFYDTSFTGNSETFFREGKRDVGLTLRRQIMKHCPDRFVEMESEYLNDRQQRGPGKRNTQ